MRILIIDDEEDIRDVLQLILESVGYDVRIASNGDMAIEFQREEPADLIITDIIMPGKNGVDIITEIKKEFPDIKVIAISGGGGVQPVEYTPEAISTTAYLAAAQKAGAKKIFTKPFERDDLIKAVEDLVGKPH
ncbi:MAG: response regulator [endosymbiont of Galathealinum brachiosum]|uniref:Response regulator n=1 Tax=endosymbiont of Galathealinum brachiosum TaxID=2200906 RepID=A0A370DNN7_9GAMM|nr:MAG: response regulator [endosymbiont of Galathealinum brachiosum]